MIEDQEFRDLIERVRAGDEQAAATLVQTYEPEIRRIARIRLHNSQMRKQLDSMDICQSVMANFFVRASLGQFEFDTPGQLLKLLVTMACNKFNDQARKQRAAKRGKGKALIDDSQVLRGVADPEEGPSQMVALKEMVDRVRSHMTDEERYLTEQRLAGRDWASLAEELKSTPDAVRKKFERTMNRLSRQMGLEELDDG